MGFKDSMIAMMGDFVEGKRNPEFRSRTDIATPDASMPTFRRDRRHSLNITVGTAEAESIPERTIRQRTFSVKTEIPMNFGDSRRRDSSDSASLKDSALSGASDIPRYNMRRASEPFNFVPRWGSNKKKQRGLLGPPSQTEGKSSSYRHSPVRRTTSHSPTPDVLEEVEDVESPPRSPLFKGSFQKFLRAPIQEENEDVETEKPVAKGTDIEVNLRGMSTKAANSESPVSVTRF
ncbi:hypothetical protein Ddc_12887 [Ditylenchus destructor]|nr:hypothetical protein Ddc_12887 [Ditylenchus destructor]